MTFEICDVITPVAVGSFTVGSTTKAERVTDLPAVHVALLQRAVTGALATVDAHGNPQTTPVWCDSDTEHVNLNSKKGRLKDRNIRRRTQVSLLLVNPDNAYHWIEIKGEVVDVIDEDDPERGHLATKSIDDLAEKYLGQRPYPLRDPSGEVRTLYQVRPTRILTFGPVGG
jgi:PPOX class probable F420-dependent enzyme